MLRPRTVSPQIFWPTLVWVLIGTEVLAILWFHVSFVPADVSLMGYRWQCEALYGSGESEIGVVRVLLVVNLIAVLGLWVAYRSARRFDGRLARATLAACLGGAVVLAGIGWWGVRTQERCPPLEVVAVYELGADGEYTVTPQ